MTLYYALDDGAFEPNRAHQIDAGIDLRTPVAFTVWPKCSKTINTGVHMQIPVGCGGFLKSKSGLNVKFSNTSEGVIDSGYTGAIVCKLYNHGWKPKHYKAGDKITQIVVMPVVTGELERVEKVNGADRGDSGFGSTGR